MLHGEMIVLMIQMKDWNYVVDGDILLMMMISATVVMNHLTWVHPYMTSSKMNNTMN